MQTKTGTLPSPEAFIKEVIHKFQNSSSMLTGLSREHVLPALLGNRVLLNDCPIEGGKTYADLIADGVYINTFESSVSETVAVIPKLSPLFLRFFIIINNNSNNKNDELAKLLFNLFSIERATYFTGYDNEDYYLNWEILRKYLLSLIKQTISVAAYYNNLGIANSSTKTMLADLNIVLDPKQLSLLKLTVNWPKVELSNTLIQNLKTHVTSLGHENPGFDGISVETVDNREKLALPFLYECKYSSLNATTSSNLAEINIKSGKAFEVYSQNSLAEKLVSAKPLFIFAAYRRVTKTKQLADKLPDNVLVLSRNDLNSLYGPTLSSRPHFLADYLSFATGLQKSLTNSGPKF
eukprot:TRINITY_DN831_c0_g1_i2.p1 TRINITY_DN831_c0_g1~~TRINITY_DN831_c0_g1_i2.p1  ORF type:complete len:351 (-),score=44.67 TRINITY_DN831_c0_g1_i2:93-1145(-)